ncbi:cysteine hydrolase family protein [Pseudomonas extremaustralis]|uniref:Cysteine hydrolase n=1 Tax=Pseudomonas extremaustralis TaxID=359110 RepID=A0A5C5QQF5_9PSED|nr:cysteine hydrolase family protein [Pseudomonas extremaustralis]EZI30232.1 isochorismatase [Pseudomonas extremaustralis 14-3 substr. 14-3b]TWS07521.1 cysteine hydrolase [Pseudomonas extremaustralis]SDE93250.1 Nicotinamidase-related amidase [Pseudomonas extremaustralis]
MYALLILDIQVGLVHGPEKPWRCEALLQTVNTLMDKARSAGAPIFLARHIGPAGSPIEPGSPLTEVAQELKLLGDEVVFEKRRPNAFEMTDLADNLRSREVTGVVITGMKTQYCVDSTCRAARDLGFDAVLIADGHTCSDTPVMKAQDIVAHHNATLAGPFCQLVQAEDWRF